MTYFPATFYKNKGVPVAIGTVVLAITGYEN